MDRNQIRMRLETVVDSAPADLVEFYAQERPPDYPQSRIHFLEFEDAFTCSKRLNEIWSLSYLLPWVLDDANDSNPYCYIMRGPCSGAVLHLSHDGDSRIEFRCLADYVAAMKRVGESGNSIDDASMDMDLDFPLSGEIESLCKEDSEDAVFLLAIYLPVCRLLTAEAKTILLDHEDFFAREAFAKWLQQNPSIENLAYAEKLAQDSYPQVAQPGRMAQSSINKMKYGNNR